MTYHRHPSLHLVFVMAFASGLGVTPSLGQPAVTSLSLTNAGEVTRVGVDLMRRLTLGIQRAAASDSHATEAGASGAASVAAAEVRAPPPPPPRPPDRRRTVALDPGHGGADPGTIGVAGTYEKDLTLAYAREFERQLEATGRYRVVLVRHADQFLSLRDRYARARDAKAELFVSIHADSQDDGRTAGASVYTLSETASDAEAAALAARENKADLISGVNLSRETAEVASILIDLAQRETMNLSATFASSLVGELGKDVRLLSKPHRFAGFAVLKAPDVPSVLLELGYLSNRSEERLLSQKGHRVAVATAFVRAVDKFFASRPRRD